MGQSPSLQYATNYDIPGRNRPRIQFKSILTPDLRCSWLYSIGVPIKIDFPVFLVNQVYFFRKVCYNYRANVYIIIVNGGVIKNE